MKWKLNIARETDVLGIMVLPERQLLFFGFGVSWSQANSINDENSLEF
jgi:hypothetical protein